MLRRQREGSIVCPTCGRLVGVRDEACIVCGTRNPSLWGFAPALRRLGEDFGFGKFLVFVCGTLMLVAVVMSGTPTGGGVFSLLAPNGRVLRLLGASGAYPVFVEGHWWTVLSAGWLHGGLLHIVFNMMWVRDLSPAVSHLFGAGRMLIIWVVGSVTGFTLSSIAGYFLFGVPIIGTRAGMTVGASAAIFALLGALVVYGRRTGQKAMRKVVWGWVVAGFLIGFLPGIDNWAHLGGFLGGLLVSRLLDPLREEKPIHILAGIVLLSVSLLAVVVSFLTGYRALGR
jgi:rhomboid protease GluP